LSKFPLFNIR